MITSLLDNDQYKFTMQQALLKLGFASTPVRYKFKCRNKDANFRHQFLDIVENIKGLSALYLTRPEHQYMRDLPYFEDGYLNFLKMFRFDPDLVSCDLDDHGSMDIQIEGPWFNTILFETPILSIISEVMGSSYDVDRAAEISLVPSLVDLPHGFMFSDFGTRRRHSFKWHEKVINLCMDYARDNFIGTSNLFFAMKYDLKAMGTVAHEWFQAHQQLGYRIADSQKMALENWIKVYRGNLGIALSDVINTEAFLNDFSDPLFYKLFDGVREDSEPNPYNFGMRICAFYKNKGIDPKTKTIVFSNGLDFEKAVELYKELNEYIDVKFGIGTKLTNNWPGYTPLNIVIKMVECNGQPVAKISNSPGKGMCESQEYVAYLKSVFHYYRTERISPEIAEVTFI